MFDERYMNLINRVKPDKPYYQQGFGDRMLYIRRVDKLKYDIIEEQKLLKERNLQRELQRARETRANGKGNGDGTNSSVAGGKAS